jgi:hypothetical protein
MNELISSYLPTAILLISLCAFAVSVITEVTKSLPGLNKIPTDIEVLVLSLVVTLVGLFVYAAYANIVLTWYLVVGGVVASFFVAFVSMFGWEKLSTLYNRFKS